MIFDKISDRKKAKKYLHDAKVVAEYNGYRLYQKPNGEKWFENDGKVYAALLVQKTRI